MSMFFQPRLGWLVGRLQYRVKELSNLPIKRLGHTIPDGERVEIKPLLNGKPSVKDDQLCDSNC